MPQPVGGVPDDVEVRLSIGRVPGFVTHRVEVDAHDGALALAGVEQPAGPVAVADVAVRGPAWPASDAVRSPAAIR